MTKRAATLNTPPLHVLRGIYRLLRSPELSKELQKKGPPLIKPTMMQRFLLDRYRTNDAQDDNGSTVNNIATTDDAWQQQQEQQKKKIDHYYRAMTVQYHNLKLDLQERDRLYKLDTGAEVQLSAKEMSRRAAARAGLQLPESQEGGGQ